MTLSVKENKQMRRENRIRREGKNEEDRVKKKRRKGRERKRRKGREREERMKRKSVLQIVDVSDNDIGRKKWEMTR